MTTPHLTHWANSRFSVPEDSAGYLLWQITHAWQRLIEAVLADLSLTHLQFVLLAGLGWLTRQNAEAQSGVTQVQLAAFCKIDGMQVSQVVRKLEVKGLVRRSVHPTDSRARLLELTDLGETTLAQAIPLVEQLDATIFQSETLLSELRALYRVLS